MPAGFIPSPCLFFAFPLRLGIVHFMKWSCRDKTETKQTHLRAISEPDIPRKQAKQPKLTVNEPNGQLAVIGQNQSTDHLESPQDANLGPIRAQWDDGLPQNIQGKTKRGIRPVRDWPAIRREYETGNLSQRGIADLMNIPRQTVMVRAMREGWKKRIAIAKRELATMEANAERKAIQRMSEDLAPWMEKQKENFVRKSYHVASRGMKRIAQFQKDNAKVDPRDEANASKAAENYHRIGRVALGMSDGSPIAGPITFNVLANRSAVQVIDSTR